MALENNEKMHMPRLRLILVVGPWSSGTTAVSGMFAKMGLNGIGPYFRTNDDRTKNSYESSAFRDVINRLASEDTLKLTMRRKESIQVLMKFKQDLIDQKFGPVDITGQQPIFLKYPLTALLIPEICSVFDTRLVYVLRPLKDIEATRLRRNWQQQFGADGARRMYSNMFNVLLNLPIPTMMIRYPELLQRPMFYAKQLANLAGVSPQSELIQAAADFIARPQRETRHEPAQMDIKPDTQSAKASGLR
jgi:hypothetical protein